MSCILALDQGTTSSRAIVFDERQQPRAVAQRELRQHYPRAGWVEHDPQELWTGQIETAREALAVAGMTRRDIAAIGITNQRETTLLWNRRSGEPLYKAIVWQDRRGVDLCERLRAQGHEARVTARTGLVIDPYFCASKIRWLLDHCDGARAAAANGELAFGTVDSYLVWQLTGGARHVTDASNAARTMLYDIDAGTWDAELLAAWDIAPELLPEVVDSSGAIAECTIAELAGVPITGIAGDQQAALFGQACFEPGMAKCTYGTGCFILLNTGTQSPRSRSRLLTTVAWSIDGRREYAIEGSVFMGGAVVQWLRDGLGIIDASAQVEALAASVPDSGGVILVPAFAGLGAPHWDPDARAGLFGMSRGTTRAHVARAALEGIAFQVADVIEAMRADSGLALRELRVDGAAATTRLLLDFQANLLQTTLIRPAQLECTALGAASLAGLAVGLWPDRATLAGLWRENSRHAPTASPRDSETLQRRWRDAVTRTLGWARQS
ncbi:MAG: glycerol kinase GlpK [Gammaproteobacteria bacterium]|nr:glycerol kinase GlpK [Gammaproteobacteria bacterium]